jgi:diazepam-binding inhibitor (GABA receptor modulating acyl-CoA-binding protein)
MDLKTQFETAAVDVKSLSKRPDDQTLLQLYALYKQATTGDTQGKRPGLFAMVERAKFDAWAKLKGTSSEGAMQSYVDLVKRLRGA